MLSHPSPTAVRRPWWREFNRSHWFVYAVASLAWLFDSVDQQLFNLARDEAVDSLARDPHRAITYGSYATSWFLVGWAIGGIIGGTLGDRWGRARMLMFAVLAYSLCTGLSAFATTIPQFFAFRLITGLGIGGVFGLAVALVADSVPDNARAPALSILQALSLVGNIGAGLAGAGIGALAGHKALPFGLAGWQVMFLLGAIPALLSIPLFGRLPEPARWLEARRRGETGAVRLGSYGTLFSHRRWSRHAWFGLILCSAGIVGLWGIGNFHPRIVRSVVDAHLVAHATSAAAAEAQRSWWSSWALVLQNLGGIGGMLVAGRIAVRFGRRVALGGGLLVSFASTALVFTSLRSLPDVLWMLPIMGFGQLSVFAVYAIYLPELFPTSLRSTGTSFCYNAGRLVAASAPFTIGMVTSRLGGDIAAFRTAGLWMSLVLLVGIVVLPFLPETRGQPLPEDDA